MSLTEVVPAETVVKKKKYKKKKAFSLIVTAHINILAVTDRTHFIGKFNMIIVSNSDLGTLKSFVNKTYNLLGL